MKYTPCGCITQANLCGLSPHGELALQANVALTPYLKLGGCGNDSLNGAQNSCLYAFHAFLTPESSGSVSASMQGEGKVPRASHLLCASSLCGCVSHKYYKPGEKRLDQLAEEE